MQDFIKINERDNVAVALRDIAAGEILEVPASPQTALQYSAVYGTSKTSAGENTERSNDRTGAMAGPDLKTFPPGIKWRSVISLREARLSSTAIPSAM